MSSTYWYVVHVHSGFENKVADHIREQAAKKGLSEQITEILVPTEDVVEIKKGEKVKTTRKFFPGYVLVKMNLSDEAWHLVQNTPKVTGFLGGGSRPSPVSQREVDRIIKQLAEGVERAVSAASFEIGENVRVIEGPFSSFSGLVEEVDVERSRLKVSVSIFGRATPVDLEFAQVEKVS